MATPSLALPGQIVGKASQYTPGNGTHLHNSNVCASVAGIISQEHSTHGTTKDALPVVSIQRITVPTHTSHATSSILPTVSATVLARVTRTNPRHATVTILVIDNVVCADGFQGLVRVQDVRATEKDKVKIADSFRPGDVVRATVISLGDQANYYLSTASNALGVVMATSEAGNAMYPVSWKEFRDPITGLSEARKVAKPS